MKPLKFEIGPDGKQRVVRMTPEEAAKYTDTESHACGLCEDSGMVEEHQYCSCAKGREMQRVDSGLPKPKISMPPDPTDQARSAFDQRGFGDQLNLFSDDQTG